MASTVTLKKFDWLDNPILKDVKTAAERTLTKTAERIQNNAKAVVHQITGTLNRSIHFAELDYEGGADYSIAKNSDLRINQVPIRKSPDGGLGIEVGSWVFYAIIEEDRHPYLKPSVEEALPFVEKYLTDEMKSLGYRKV